MSGSTKNKVKLLLCIICNLNKVYNLVGVIVVRVIRGVLQERITTLVVWVVTMVWVVWVVWLVKVVRMVEVVGVVRMVWVVGVISMVRVVRMVTLLAEHYFVQISVGRWSLLLDVLWVLQVSWVFGPTKNKKNNYGSIVNRLTYRCKPVKTQENIQKFKQNEHQVLPRTKKKCKIKPPEVIV